MRTQLLSTLVWIFPPSFCPWPLGGDVSVAELVCIFSCRLLRSSAIRFNTNSRSWQTNIHKTRCSVLRSQNQSLGFVITNYQSGQVGTVWHQKSVFSTLLTFFFCLRSALASWATRCLCCSSKSLLSCLMRDSMGSGSGDRLHDCDGFSTNDGDAFKIKKQNINLVLYPKKKYLQYITMMH